MLRIDFRVKSELYAVPARRVAEVIPRVVLRPVPAAPPGVAGLFVYRGQVTPVVDLSLLIANEPCPDRLSSRIMVLELRGKEPGQKRMVGLLAEGVTVVVADARAPEPGLALPGAPFLGDVARSGDRLVQLLEPESLLPEEIHASLLLETATGLETGRNPDGRSAEP